MKIYQNTFGFFHIAQPRTEHHMNLMSYTYELIIGQKLHYFLKPQVVPCSQQELYTFCPIQRTQGSFEPFGMWLFIMSKSLSNI